MLKQLLNIFNKEEYFENSFKLSFNDKQLESLYIKEISNKNMHYNSNLLNLGLAIYLSFIVTDYLIYQKYFFQLLIIKSITFMIIYFGSRKLQKSNKIDLYNNFLYFSFLLVGLSLLLFMHIVKDLNLTFFPGFLVLFWFTFTIFKVNSVKLLALSGIIIILLNLFMFFVSKFSIVTLILNNMFIITSIVTGLFVSYFFAYFERKNFYLTYNLEKKNKELKESNDTKDKFFSIVSHDLKNPFNIIHGFSDILMESRDKFKEDILVTSIESIHKTSKTTYELLENLLNWSKTQLHKIKYNPDTINVYSSLINVISALISLSNLKNIEIKIDIDKSQNIDFDPNIFYTVLRNLITNSIKFSYENSEILIFEEIDESFYKIVVKDFGTGIDYKQKDELFKVDNTESIDGTKGEKGTGLGLILCYELLKLGNAKIDVESEYGKGSKFIVKIPLS